MAVSEIVTDSSSNPIPLFIYPGDSGDKLAVGTTIQIVLVPSFHARIKQIGIPNLDSNVKTISVKYIGVNGQPINKISTNKKHKPTIVNTDLPKVPVTQIFIKIEELYNKNKDAKVTLSILGCYNTGKFKKLDLTIKNNFIKTIIWK